MHRDPKLIYEALDSVGVGMAILDSQERFVGANRTYRAMVGLIGVLKIASADEPAPGAGPGDASGGGDLSGRHWRDTVAERDRGPVEEAFAQARGTGRAYVEIRPPAAVSPAANSPVAVSPAAAGPAVVEGMSITRLADPDGIQAGFCCVRHDISSPKRIHNALLLAVESAPNGLLMLNAAGLIESVNQAVEKLFGYSRAELIGSTVEMLLPGRFRSRHLKYRENFSTHAMAGRDLCGLRKDGVEIPVQVYLNRIDAGSGDLILCTVIDIAERVTHEQQLKIATQAAEDANRAKSDFLARMSHEIRTPMNLIMGMNALLLKTPLNDQQRQQVEISYRNVRRLLRLINGILDLSKVEAGQMTLEAAPFDLKEVLAEATGTLAVHLEQKGLQLGVFLEPNVWRFWSGDAERLQQVLLNLLGNSVKFTARGHIDVRVSMENPRDTRADSRAHDPALRLGAGLPSEAGPRPDPEQRPDPGQRPDAGLRFEVSDTGCGVPPDQSHLIFEPFQQADGSMNRTYQGTGLGLAIARTLVEMMGGRIWVKETSPAGSTFAFTAFMPRATEAQARERLAQSDSDTAVPALKAGARILVVEDNPENQILVEAYLDGLGLIVEFANNGVEGVHKSQHSVWDLILMDIQMPIMDGYTATREIRLWQSNHGLPPVPIVALTAHALSGASQESSDAGCDGHLTKPLDRGDLLRAIAKFARKPASRLNSIEDAIRARRPAFLSNRRRDLERLLAAVASQDFSTVQSIGHDCKGTGTPYGFPEISRLGLAIETAARSQDLEQVTASIREFEQCLAAAAGS